MIPHLKKAIAFSVIVAAGALTISSFAPRNIQPKPKKLVNIKVLPSDWTYQQVDHEMDVYKAALNVKCNYCHAADKASDENPVKNIAREMIKMTDEMNKKYVSQIPHADTVKIQSVTCYTCHRGEAKIKAEMPKFGPPPPPPSNTK